jgi:hypothetical protein
MKGRQTMTARLSGQMQLIARMYKDKAITAETYRKYVAELEQYYMSEAQYRFHREMDRYLGKNRHEDDFEDIKVKDE